MCYFLVLTDYSLLTCHFLLSISDFYPPNQSYRSKINSRSFRAAPNFGSGTGNCVCTDMSPRMSQTENLIKGERDGKSMTCATGTLWKGSYTYWQGDEDKEKRNATVCICFLKWSWKELTSSTGQNSQGSGIRLFSLKEESIQCLGNCSWIKCQNTFSWIVWLPCFNWCHPHLHPFLMSAVPHTSEPRAQTSHRRILPGDLSVHCLRHVELIFKKLW